MERKSINRSNDGDQGGADFLDRLHPKKTI